MQNPVKFNLPSESDLERFIGELGDQYVIKKKPNRTETIRIYDTFDWRLFNKSLVLYECGDKLCLRKLSKREMIHSVTTHPRPFIIVNEYVCNFRVSNIYSSTVYAYT